MAGYHFRCRAFDGWDSLRSAARIQIGVEFAGESEHEVWIMPGPIVKTLLLSGILIALPALAQETRMIPAGIPACGNLSARFEVKTGNGPRSVQPEPGRALVYFIQNDRNFNAIPKPTTRLGVDGKWLGATHGDSYLYAFVDPGVHHLCASRQSRVIKGVGLALAHFSAKADGVYYFQIEDEYLLADTFGAINKMTLTPMDSDEGQLMTGTFKLSTSHLKQ